MKAFGDKLLATIGSDECLFIFGPTELLIIFGGLTQASSGDWTIVLFICGKFGLF